MASSNRHWPSMFKSKPCNNQPWSSHHLDNHLSNSSSRSSHNSTFSSGGEERSTPEPKPRWNPKPEQIRILEAIFNSGMVNPPRDEIRRIRAQLQEYGHVGDANVFYWFQNRKSRSKNKQRTLQAKTTTTATANTNTNTSSSSSSSDKSSPNGSINNINKNNICNNSNLIGGGGGEQFGNSPTSVNQCNTYFHNVTTPNNSTNNTNNNPRVYNNEFVSNEPVYFPLHQSGASLVGNNYSQGLCFSNNFMNEGDPILGTPPSNQTIGGGFSSLLFGDMFNGGGDELKRDGVEKFKYQNELSFLELVSTPNNTASVCSTIGSASPVVSAPASSTAFSTNLGQIIGVGEAGGVAEKTTVFINGMAIEVPSMPLNVKEEFGEEVMLVHANSGQPVLTNEWGVTLDALQHGSSYYLVNPAHLVAFPLLDKFHPSSDLLSSDFPYQI